MITKEEIKLIRNCIAIGLSKECHMTPEELREFEKAQAVLNEDMDYELSKRT